MYQVSAGAPSRRCSGRATAARPIQRAGGHNSSSSVPRLRRRLQRRPPITFDDAYAVRDALPKTARWAIQDVRWVSPQTRYTYTLANGEYRVTGVSQCQTTSSCSGTADEVKTVIAYNADGSVYWTATGNGSETLVATTTMAYDSIGNLATVDGPLSGNADTVRTRYNTARQVVGTISPVSSSSSLWMQHLPQPSHKASHWPRSSCSIGSSQNLLISPSA